MSFKESILNKSNSYIYYKETTEKSLKEIDKLKKETNDLKNENQCLKEEMKKLSDENNSLKTEKLDPSKVFQKHYGSAPSFCGGNYIEYFLKDEFGDKLNNVTNNLDERNTRLFKWYVLRAFTASFMRRETLYFDFEIRNFRVFHDFKKEHVTPEGICGFKYTGEYNLASFVDLNLNESDLEFIKNKDIIDAGAYTGDTALPLSKLTNKNIYAFEPFKESFDLLTKNINDNNIENIIPINKSLGNIVGERTLYLSGNNVQGITSDSKIRSYDNEIKVQETTIDTFVDENKLDVGYITIDVEGAEMDLLNGAKNTIKTQRPILIISLYHRASDFFEIIPWVADLNLGYEFELFKEKPASFIADIVVQCRPK